ncbi:MAG: CPBP family intramembrane metalloprotease [Candidatus Thorarchaeota archaeon]|nr:MAG: CPBP family intramembrane metalloprotease [Candidatus Thorarchaeota archaeon]
MNTTIAKTEEMKTKGEMKQIRSRRILYEVGMAAVLVIVASFGFWGAYASGISTELRILVFVGLPAGFLVAALVTRLNQRYTKYWEISFIFFAIFGGILVSALLSHTMSTVLLQYLGLETSNPYASSATLAVLKFSEVALSVVPALILIGIAGINLQSVYLKGGDKRRALKYALLPIGIVVLVALTELGVLLTIGLDDLLVWTPGVIVFSFSNAFMEEFWFRGLLLGKSNELMSSRASLMWTSIAFGMMHFATNYGVGVEHLVFVAITLILGLAFGYAVLKSDSIWGAVVAHAIGDIFFVFLVLAAL